MFPSTLNPEQLTAMFRRARGGDRIAAELFYRLAIPRLERIAGSLLGRFRGHSMLEPNALVNEGCIKFGFFNLEIQCRKHFYRIAVRSMRQVLSDNAARERVRRQNEELVRKILTPSSKPGIDRLILVKQVVEKLQKFDKAAAKALWLHEAEDLTWDEAAERTGRPIHQLRKDTGFALEWLRNQVSN